MFTNDELRILHRVLHAHIQELDHDTPEFRLFQKISTFREIGSGKYCQHYFVKAHPLSPDKQQYICLNCDMVKSNGPT